MTANPPPFELVWATAEELFANDTADINSIILELISKLTVYKSLNAAEIPADERTKSNEYMMGKILLALAHLSQKENINIYPALKNAIASYRMDRLEQLIKPL